jgi:hypothetical protein
MTKSIVTLSFSLLIALCAFAHASYDCLPESAMSFPIMGQKSGDNDLKMRVDQQLAHFKAVMGPIVKKAIKKDLSLKLDWENPRVNASATRDEADNPILILLGGMVRHPQLTPDGLYGILCHELGHHLAGSPKKRRGRSDKLSWSSAEGQADYYSTSVCLPKVFHKPNYTTNPAHYSDSKEVSYALELCSGVDRCVRVSLAGLSMARVFASLRDYGDLPRLESTDYNEAWETILGHPDPQCRLLVSFRD